MLYHYYKEILAGCALLFLSACDNVPDGIAQTHREASAAEQTAVGALNRLDAGLTGDQLEELRSQYEQAASEARQLREGIRAELQSAIDARWISSDKLPEAVQLNDDLLRCHETLRKRAEDAFQFVASGRVRRASLDDVWGLVDPRTCFDELAPAWDVLLR